MTHLTLHQNGADQDARRLPSPTAVLERISDVLPANANLQQNCPNPFNGMTSTRFALATEAEVELAVYSLSGQQVTTLVPGWRQAGDYTLTWDGVDDAGRELASGLYMYRIQMGSQQVWARRLVLIRSCRHGTSVLLAVHTPGRQR